jgi:prepilin-type N-terminal cleavage/methylation domain-containing protein
MSITKKKISRGFTLQELLVVMSIIALFSSVIFASFNSARVKANDASRLVTAKEIVKAMDLYYLDNQEYPEMYENNGVPFDPVTGCVPTCGARSLSITVDNHLVPKYYPKSVDNLWLSNVGTSNYIKDYNEIRGFGIRIYQESTNTHCRVGSNMNPQWWNPTPNPPIEMLDC